jgi:carboxymethylenebutenolidase
MSTSRPSTCAWSSWPAVIVLVWLLPALADTPSQRPQPLPPFLHVFKAPAEPPPAVSEVAIPSAVGPVRGYLARPATPESLPAILLLPDAFGLTAWMKQNARELSGVGYVVLALDVAVRPSTTPKDVGTVPPDEYALAQMSAAVRWLRRRRDVLPQRIGVVGWSSGADHALLLAGSLPLQACVLCDPVLTIDQNLLSGLRGTPLLGILAARDDSTRRSLPAFRQALTAARILHRLHIIEGVQKGFMAPASTTYSEHYAEKVWVEIYEFLGKYVEDGPDDVSVTRPSATKPVATIADLMRSVNDPCGVRGTLLDLLAKEPTNELQWSRARSSAALIAEVGRLLQAQAPPKGPTAHWREQTRVFMTTAESIVTAAGRHDYAAAKRGLQELATRCTACHERHR